MKKKLITLSILLILCACSKEDSKQLSTGGTLHTPLNDAPSVGVSYRINQDAINSHSALLVSADFKTWKKDWPEIEADKLSLSIEHLNGKTSSDILRSNVTETNAHIIEFAQGTTLELTFNRELSKLQWRLSESDVFEASRISTDTWEIKTPTQTYLWRPELRFLSVR